MPHCNDKGLMCYPGQFCSCICAGCEVEPDETLRLAAIKAAEKGTPNVIPMEVITEETQPTFKKNPLTEELPVEVDTDLESQVTIGVKVKF